MKLPGAKLTLEGWYQNSDAIDNYLNDMKADVQAKIDDIAALVASNVNGALTEE
jgi:hypothetical protein